MKENDSIKPLPAADNKDQFEVDGNIKTIDNLLLSIIGLFIPVPICQFNYLFTYRNYGFGYSIFFHSSKYKKLQIPLGWIMIIIALIL